MCVLFSIVQGADWHFGPHNFGAQPHYVRQAALATMIICFIGFIAYLIFLVSLSTLTPVTPLQALNMLLSE